MSPQWTAEKRSITEGSPERVQKDSGCEFIPASTDDPHFRQGDQGHHYQPGIHAQDSRRFEGEQARPVSTPDGRMKTPGTTKQDVTARSICHLRASRFWYYETVWASSHWEPDLPESHLSSNSHPKLFPRTGGGSCPMCGAEASSEWRVLKGVSGGYHCSRCRYLCQLSARE